MFSAMAEYFKVRINSRRFTWIVCLLALTRIGAVMAVDGNSSPSAPPVYKPPSRGAPALRVGGGTRDLKFVDLSVHAMVPEHTGLTSQARPVLYWYLSAPFQGRVELTVADEKSGQPLLETAFDNVSHGGVQAVQLADYGVTLQPDVEYQWSVALVADPDQRSKDILTGGGILLAAPSQELAAKAARATEKEKVYLYAEAGYWYDAIQAAQKLVEKQPHDVAAAGMRASLLQQAGVPVEAR
ncbi:MAG: DUF928 domain-containing protein [Methylococcaceae bacterium]|nr:MAG: DUF928 domain-containing protein [Methylococcaceae bacterium]